jgi:DNA-binding SARP family transcriptional activator
MVPTTEDVGSECGILGPLRFVVGRADVHIGGAKRRTLLARLVVDVNHVVSADELIDCLWAGHSSMCSKTTLQSHVTHLRRALGPAACRVKAESPGYVLDLASSSVDFCRFEQDVASATRCGDVVHRVRILQRALAEWRGRALVEFEGSDWADRAAGRLEELRLCAVEDLAESRLLRGDGAEVVAEIGQLVAAYPLRSTLVALLMRALNRCGRELEAIRVFERFRKVLGEAGLDPPEAMVNLERSIVLHAGDETEPLSPIALEGYGAAVSHCARAGHQALNRRAADVAVTHFQNALLMLNDSGRSDETMRCELLLNLGEAQRRTPEARHAPTFAEAALLAETIGDMERMTRAAKGYSRSFVTVCEPMDPQRIAVVTTALNECGRADSAWRARLLACLAGELQFGQHQTRSLQLIDEAIAVADRVGDEPTIAAVSAIAWDVMWHPRTLSSRSALSRDMQRRAERGGDPMRQWRAGVNRVMDMYAAGETTLVDSILERAVKSAEQLGGMSTDCATSLLQGTKASIVGDLDRAAALALRVVGAPAENEIPDLRLGAAALLASVRVLQRRPIEDEPLLASLSSNHSGARALRALIDSSDGRLEAAGEALRELVLGDVEAIPEDAGWSFTVAICAEVASELTDVVASEVLYRTLHPFADQCLAHGCYFFGSVEHYLGTCSAVLGDIDRALDHFERSEAHHRRMGAPVLQARTIRARAAALRRRVNPGDGARADQLEAVASSSERGCRTIQ